MVHHKEKLKERNQNVIFPATKIGFRSIMWLQ
jgi:hypothetical protein